MTCSMEYDLGERPPSPSPKRLIPTSENTPIKKPGPNSKEDHAANPKKNRKRRIFPYCVSSYHRPDPHSIIAREYQSASKFPSKR